MPLRLYDEDDQHLQRSTFSCGGSRRSCSINTTIFSHSLPLNKTYHEQQPTQWTCTAMVETMVETATTALAERRLKNSTNSAQAVHMHWQRAVKTNLCNSCGNRTMPAHILTRRTPVHDTLAGCGAGADSFLLHCSPL